MMRMRPIHEGDLDTLESFAYAASVGMTSLPHDRALLKEKILASLEAFAKKVEVPVDEEYLFVLEDLSTGQVGGISGIIAKAGSSHPFFCYSMHSVPNATRLFAVPKQMWVLEPHCYSEGGSEIFSLFLHPNYRRGGLGKLLSYSRFLFIAAFRNRFESEVIAEMRGVFNRTWHSPFWEEFGRRFIDVEYSELAELISTDRGVVAEIVPKYPTYCALLPEKVKKVIGKTHHNTRRALQMLQEEGFEKTNYLDLFDGGPLIKAKTEEIVTIKKSQVVTVGAIQGHNQRNKRTLLANERLQFHACYGSAEVITQGVVKLTEEVAAALEVQVGDPIRLTH